ncbi:hypothetical protein [Aliarcobacter butzleri]|uniref:hypothetical protein n=1 Tax=Aliarcobacter butzleri TaxID=28197 RepID=UPI002B250EC8|nr:hypothetical protein [Aliarcobacter butzleri]
MIIKNIKITECNDGLLHHTLGVRSYNQSYCCNWCYKPLKYSTQHLCSSCRNRNRLGTLYSDYRGISKLTHLTKQVKKYNTDKLQYKINQVLLKTCKQSNFFKTNYYNYWLQKEENKGNFTKLYRITQIALLYTLDWILEPKNYNNRIEIYYRFLTQAITRNMAYDRKYYSALPTTVSDFIGLEIFNICISIFVDKNIMLVKNGEKK